MASFKWIIKYLFNIPHTYMWLFVGVTATTYAPISLCSHRYVLVRDCEPHSTLSLWELFVCFFFLTPEGIFTISTNTEWGVLFLLNHVNQFSIHAWFLIFLNVFFFLLLENDLSSTSSTEIKIKAIRWQPIIECEILIYRVTKKMCSLSV